MVRDGPYTATSNGRHDHGNRKSQRWHLTFGRSRVRLVGCHTVFGWSITANRLGQCLWQTRCLSLSIHPVSESTQTIGLGSILCW